ncbi:unnamed protein product [Symbiodinium necroappetens]|uniref:RRM domain-containing protein n=1 Tax=Symbiodinium necroappetens TaxID=1628268 RepID=A0A812KGK1_9DINO|nr:unnamed protein product [Symbiodinium necroappetens]
MAFAARNSIYIRNLSPQVSEQVLRETFGQCDAIERVLFRSYQGRTAEFFAQVDFATSKGVLEAHQLSGTKVMGQAIEISVMDPGSKDMARKMWNVQRPWETVPEDQEEEAATNTEPQGVQAEYFRKFKEAEEDKRLRTVHIAGLAPEVTDEDVRVICKQFGELEALRLDKDSDGQPFALVEFKERGSAQVVKRTEKFLVEERVLAFTEAKTMVDTTSFAEQSVHFNQPAFDTTTMKVVLAYQCHLNPKLAKAKLAAAQIAGEEIPQELIDAANEKPKEEEEPIVWEGRGERSCPLAAREVPKEPEKRPRDHDRGQNERERKPRRRRSGMDSRERHHASRSRSRRPRHRRRRKPDPDKAKPDKATPDKATPDKAEKSAKADARKLAAQKALAAMQDEMAPKPAREKEEEDEVEAVPNTELFVLGSSESYSYEEEEEATKEKEEKVMDEAAKAALEAAQAAEEEAKRQAEAARKAEEEERQAIEAQKEAEAEEARQAALREQERKAKEEEVSLVRSSSQATGSTCRVILWGCYAILSDI